MNTTSQYTVHQSILSLCQTNIQIIDCSVITVLITRNDTPISEDFPPLSAQSLIFSVCYLTWVQRNPICIVHSLLIIIHYGVPGGDRRWLTLSEISGY